MTTAEVRAAGNEANRQRGLERAREVVRLIEEGLSVTDVAERLGVTPASARSIMTRSRRRLGIPTPGARCDVCDELLERDGSCRWACEPQSSRYEGLEP